MSDLWLDWGGDFIASADGDLLLAADVDEANQAIVRRLFTAVKGYVFHPEYGAGLLQKIGTPGNATAIQAIVSSQIVLEASVAPSPPPVTTVTEASTNPGLFVISINYTTAKTGEPTSLSFTV